MAPLQSRLPFPEMSEPLHQNLSEFAVSSSASPGAGLGSILGPRVGADVRPSRSQTTGSAWMAGEQDVKLYMYDLSKGMAKTIAPVLGSWLSAEAFDGVWHSSVVVFGKEYFFNGELVHVSPGETTWGSPTKVVTIGHTSCSREALHQFVVEELRAVFNKSSYDALYNNCNHYADRVCMYLCKRHIPDYILQQHKQLAKLPALRLMRPFLDQWLGGGMAGSNANRVEATELEASKDGKLFARMELGGKVRSAASRNSICAV